MINHHPNTNILSEYAAGSLGVAESIAVSAHLNLCRHCQQQVSQLESLGSAVFSSLETSQKPEVSYHVFGAVMTKIESDTEQPQTNIQNQAAKQDPALSELPPVLAKLIGKKSALNWKKLSSSLQIAAIRTGQETCEVSLHKISAGGKVMEHDHNGLEYTLVLKGSFSDEEGVYHPGDFLLRQPGEKHKPYAAANRDCLCLTVVEAPVRFTGLISRLLNPFLKIQPL